jgi:hypothetical protein
MLQTKIIEKIKTRIFCAQSFFFRKSCRLGNNVENIVEAGGPQMTIWRTRIECWITKVYTHTHTHSKFVILTAPALQQWLHERASILRILPSLLNFKRAQNALLSTDVLKGWHNTTCQYVPCLCFSFCDDMFYSFLNCMLGSFMHGEVVFMCGYDSRI